MGVTLNASVTRQTPTADHCSFMSVSSSTIRTCTLSVDMVGKPLPVGVTLNASAAFGKSPTPPPSATGTPAAQPMEEMNVGIQHKWLG